MRYADILSNERSSLWQFGLRSLFVVVTALSFLAALAGCWVSRARTQAATVSALSRLDCDVVYDVEYSGSLVEMSYLPNMRDLPPHRDTSIRAFACVWSYWDVDLFRNVVAVQIDALDVESALPQLTKLTHLAEVNLIVPLDSDFGIYRRIINRLERELVGIEITARYIPKFEGCK